MLRPSSLRSPGKSIGGLAVLIGLIFLPAVGPAAEQTVRPLPWRERAEAAEKRGEWLEACRCYDEILRKDRTSREARDGYLRCLRRLHLVARHSDRAYRDTLAQLNQEKALITYQQVLGVLAYSYPDRARTDLHQLFQQGLHEAQLALDDPVFRKHHLSGVKPETIAAFKARLAKWPVRKMVRPHEPSDQVWKILKQASGAGLPTRSTFGNALVLEFAAGACNSLDEYSSFLTPGHLAMAQSGVRGKMVGVGMDVAWSPDNKSLQIARVYPKGPAQEASLQKGDQILKIRGQAVDKLSSDKVADMLRGLSGSVVEIEYQPADRNRTRQTVRLKRRASILPAVENLEVRQLDDSTPVGYLRINYFTDNSVQEVLYAMSAVRNMGGMNDKIKGLILDLRGNPGGVFPSAVAVAELFLSGSVVVVGQSHFPDFNGTFKSESGATFQFPIVVLIDSETASSAEVLAAALRDSKSNQTRLVGQPSFGKGSVQCLIQLKKAPLDKMAGIRLTVARLFSPSNQPLTGKGLTPDIPVKPDSDIMVEAEKALKKLINGEPAPGAVVRVNPM